LENVDTNNPSYVVYKWKRSKEVKSSFDKLYSLIPDENITYFQCIIKSVWTSAKHNKITKNMEAFTYAVINCVLNDAYDGVKVEDGYIQDKMEDYLVCN